MTMVFRIGPMTEGRTVQVTDTGEKEHPLQLSARQSGTNYAISFRLTRSEAVALAGALRSMVDSLAYDLHDLDAKFPPAKDTD